MPYDDKGQPQGRAACLLARFLAAAKSGWPAGGTQDAPRSTPHEAAGVADQCDEAVKSNHANENFSLSESVPLEGRKDFKSAADNDAGDHDGADTPDDLIQPPEGGHYEARRHRPRHRNAGGNAQAPRNAQGGPQGQSGKQGGVPDAQKDTLKKRFLIAVMPPDDVIAPLERIKLNGPQDWDWKRSGDYHITLVTPGMMNDAQLGKLMRVLEGISFPAFDMQIEGLSYFLKNPAAKRRSAQNVLWAKADHGADQALQKLHMAIIDAMKDAQMKTGTHGITPHLTLAKVPANDNSLVTNFARAHDNMRSRVWRCDRFGLYQTLDRSDARHPDNNNGQGSRYIKVAEFKLG